MAGGGDRSHLAANDRGSAGGRRRATSGRQHCAAHYRPPLGIGRRRRRDWQKRRRMDGDLSAEEEED